MGSRMPDSPPAQQPTQPPAVANALSATRYLAWLYSPPEQQPALAALCEIENEVLSSLRPGIDHHVAHTRLQWWREECERSTQGRPEHPLTRDLMKTYRSGAVQAGILGFVDTAVWDLAAATFETRKELTAYCERWATAMFQSAASMSEAEPIAPPAGSGATASNGAVTRSSSLRWRKLGAAVREIELLANLSTDAHAGRLRVPVDELEHAGVEVEELGKPPWPAPLANLLRGRHETLRAAVTDIVSDFEREEQARFRGLMVWAALAWRQSIRIQRALPTVVLPRRYHALSDGWYAWRAARRAVGGHLRLS
jgi:15-cis-phytoene synthase